MEVIRDNDYQEWGECDGRTCYRTCHVSINGNTKDAIFGEEHHALSLLPHRDENSRKIKY